MNPHYFWAVQLPVDTKKLIFNHMEQLKSTFPFKRWVHMMDYHITLSFLGSVETEKVKPVIDIVGEEIKSISSFPLHLTGLGVFGNKVAPRIFWVAVNHEKKLFNLQKSVHNACKNAGFILESRSFNPHITIARNWIGNEFEKNIIEENNPFQSINASFTVDEVVLYKTNLEQTPKYEPIATFSLLVE